MHTRGFSKRKEWQDSVDGHNYKTQKRHCTPDYKNSWVDDQEQNGAAKGSEQLEGWQWGCVCASGAGQWDRGGSLQPVTLGLPCHSSLPSFCSTHTFSTLPYLLDSTAVFSIYLGKFFTFHKIVSLFSY